MGSGKLTDDEKGHAKPHAGNFRTSRVVDNLLDSATN
jgi:hypothetical protein